VHPSDRIPLFHGEKQQKPLIPALRRPNLTLQVVDSICIQAKFRCAAEQRNFSAEQRNYLTEQRNCSGIDPHDFLTTRHHTAAVSAPLWMPWNGLISVFGRSGEPAIGAHGWGK
jgi:hypothetical protein